MQNIKRVLVLSILALSIWGCGTSTPCGNLNEVCENWNLFKKNNIDIGDSSIDFSNSLTPVEYGENPYVRTKEKRYAANEIYENEGDIYISTDEGLIHYPANGDGKGKTYDIQDLSEVISAKDTILVLKGKSVYKLDPNGKLTIIPDNDIIDKVVKMTSSPDGTVYVALDDGKIMKSDDLGDNWVLVDSSPSREVTDIYADNTKIYVGTKNDGLQVYSPGGGFIKSYKTTTNPSLTSDHIIGVEKKDGKVYVLTSNSFMVLDEATDTWKTYTTADGLLTNSMTSFDVLDENNIYLGSEKGISYTNDGGDTWKSYKSITNLDVNDLHAINPTELLVTNNEGVHLVNLTDLTVLSRKSEGGLPKNIQINDMAIHNDGTIYLATEEHGVLSSKDLETWESYGDLDIPVKKISIDTDSSDDDSIFLLTDKGLSVMGNDDGSIQSIETTNTTQFPDGWIDTVVDIKSYLTESGKHYLFVLTPDNFQAYTTVNDFNDWLDYNNADRLSNLNQRILNTLHKEDTPNGASYSLIVGSESMGVLVANGGINSDNNDMHYQDRPPSNPHDDINDIVETEGNYYLATNNGIIIYSSNDFLQDGERFIPEYNSHNLEKCLDIDVSIIDNKRYMSIIPETINGVANNNIYYLIDADKDLTTTNNQELKELSSLNGVVSGNIIQSEFDSSGNLIILTTKGVTKYSSLK